MLTIPTKRMFLLSYGCGFLHLFFVGTPAQAKEKKSPTLRGTLTWEIRSQVEHNYLIFFPKEYRKSSETEWPLLVYLHGGGGNEALLKRQLGMHDDKPFIILAPICPDPPDGVPLHFKNWDPQPLGAIIRHVTKKYPIRKNQCSLMGFSMGGSGAWALPFYHPDLFASVVIMSGSCHPWKLKHFPNIPVRSYSGSKETWLPQHKNTVNTAKSFGVEVTHFVWPGANHGACRQRTMEDQSMWNWLSDAVREDPEPPN